MGSPTVLISGAGVAGSTLAAGLARRGWRPTVVERAGGLRSSGNPVDVRGPALAVADAMGVLPAVRDAATHATHLTFLDPAGRPVSRVPTAAGRRAGRSARPDARADEVEIQRGDLAAILLAAAREDAELLWGDTIVGLEQDEAGVDVTFDHAAPRRFDLVVGADGLHSNVRRLAFGPEPRFVRHLGLNVATVGLGGPSDHPHDVLLHNTPGRLVSIHPARGNAVAAFIFRGPAVPSTGRGDAEAHRRTLETVYAGAGWRVPELLERFREAGEDVYADAVSLVRLDAWSHGRVTLLGDAASCVSLLGDGSSLAMAGAATLADALAEAPDHRTALARYETRHRVRVTGKQRAAGPGARLLVPGTRAGIAVRNLAVRTLPLLSYGTRFAEPDDRRAGGGTGRRARCATATRG